MMENGRIRNQALKEKIVSSDQAASLIADGMVIGMSGFTRAGDAKLVPLALVKRAQTDPFKITLLTGASLGHDLDGLLCNAGITARRMPFQVDSTLRHAINRGEVMFVDQHLSETVEHLRSGQLAPVDVAIIEAVAICEDGGIIPTTSVGNSASFVAQAKKVIVEINTTCALAMEGLHDIYIPQPIPGRTQIPIVKPDDRIGKPYITVDPDKIAAIVISDMADSPSNILPADAETAAIANHLIEFLIHEMKMGRYSHTLRPLQAGIGTIANAVLSGFLNSPFYDLQMYSEVLQDSTFDLMDCGKLAFASASSITLSDAYRQRVFDNIEKYKNRLILRPQEISNMPGVIRRLGLIAINTALEFDIYGNVNSTHINGSHVMNGIGGSGDFARNAALSIFVTKSIAKGGKISSVVPMVTHVDHTEHDVDILVTEQGLADLRGLAPRERAACIIKNCVAPLYHDKIKDYFDRAVKRGGQTPHMLEEAFSWHVKMQQQGSML